MTLKNENAFDAKFFDTFKDTIGMMCESRICNIICSSGHVAKQQIDLSIIVNDVFVIITPMP